MSPVIYAYSNRTGRTITPSNPHISTSIQRKPGAIVHVNADQPKSTRAERQISKSPRTPLTLHLPPSVHPLFSDLHHPLFRLIVSERHGAEEMAAVSILTPEITRDKCTGPSWLVDKLSISAGREGVCLSNPLPASDLWRPGAGEREGTQETRTACGGGTNTQEAEVPSRLPVNVPGRPFNMHGPFLLLLSSSFGLPLFFSPRQTMDAVASYSRPCPPAHERLRNETGNKTNDGPDFASDRGITACGRFVAR
ncbi:hypothetical protein DPEC_G00173250 [Dallia pectoralis]|uniref:Uncharacterized protein n=1 Tax=Dallia pectoralis TaxID=75939 RepID=A0ACC2GE58_DALPE|nr:hypothetical protein DPEC_G00173250 [Dallia pectoralis]